MRSFALPAWLAMAAILLASISAIRILHAQSAGAAPQGGTLIEHVPDGLPVARAEVVVAQSADASSRQIATADAAGDAHITGPSGVYGVSVEAGGHDAALRDDLIVHAGENVAADIALPAAAAIAPGSDASGNGTTELSGVEVRGAYTAGGQTLYLDERRSSAVVTEAIGAEQIARTGDSDVATTLRRVTGLSLVDGKYVYVRGLGERYSSVLLNGAPIPSPDYTRRVVPLDLFPTELIDGVIVQKSYSPDMPGEFGGGTVQLRTVEVPRAFFFRVKGTVGYTDGTTWEDGLRYDGGGRDWTGYDDGSRALPDSLASAISGGRYLRPQSSVNPDGATPEELAIYGSDLAAGGYGIYPQRIGPDNGYSVGIGNSYNLGEDMRLGFIGASLYSQDWDTAAEQRNTYAASNTGLSPVAEQDVDATLRNIDDSFFLGLGLEIGNDHRLGLTRMLLRQTDDRAKVSDGTVDSVDSRYFEQIWVENQLAATQLNGHHAFPLLHNLQLDWQYTDAQAGRKEPNTRRYRYDYVGLDTLEFSRRSDSNSQTFGRLDDTQDDASVSAMVPFDFADGSLLNLSAGAARTSRDRDSSIRTFTFQLAPGSPLPVDNPDFFLQPIETILDPANIRPDGFVLRETTRATDNYFAEQTITAGFLNADFNFRGKYRVSLGARHEKNAQNVTTYSIIDSSAPPVVAADNASDWLPALSLTWAYSDNAQVRAGFSRTLSRPDFRELSSAPYTDPELDIDTIGNPDLDPTRIENIDLRWEYYFSDSDNLSVAAFDKTFRDPIEKLRLAGSSPLLGLANAQSAHNYGAEVELYKSLGFIGNGIPGHFDWNRFYVAGNYAWINSTIELDAESASYQTNLSRSMQGQSPYVGNLQLGYLDPDRGLEATLLFNSFGRRISEVGVQGQPDIYQESFDALDFQFRQRFAEDWRWTLRLRNLLDSKVQYTQGGLSTREYSPGRAVLLSLEWRPRGAR